MRIAHVTDAFAPDVGGIERQVQTLARTQVAQGHDVTVITAVAKSGPIDSELHVVRAAAKRWISSAFPWSNRRLVAEVLDSGRFDVVHAHFSVISPLAVYVTRAASRRRIPVAITVHSLWWRWAFAARCALLPFGWGRLRAAWSAVSSVAAVRVRRALPRLAADVSVVPNLVETHWWRRPSPAPAETKQATTGRVHLVLVGRLRRRKHVAAFLSALAHARTRLPPATSARVTIVGDGPRRADLEAQLLRLGLTDWVDMVGARTPTEIRALLHTADAFVVSSRHEAFGMAALEARAAGLPVVSYRANGVSDFIEHRVDGLLVDDSDHLTDALTDLIGDHRLVEQLTATTRLAAPSLTAHDALTAVDDLYRDARAIGTARPLNRIRTKRPLLQRRPRWWYELTIIAVFYEAYNAIQHLITGRSDRAMSNGHRILRLEQALHLDPESALNRLVDHLPALAVPACYAYTTLHFLVTPAVLVWARYVRPDTYRRARATLVLMTLSALAGFLWFPTAPPRLLTGGGFVDTVSRFSNWGWWQSNSLPSGARALENAYAAMPSLHVAWSVWSAATVLSISRRPVVRLLAAAYPVITAVVVMATANHYLADVIVGAALWPVARWFIEVWERRRTGRGPGSAPRRDRVDVTHGTSRVAGEQVRREWVARTVSGVRALSALRFPKRG